MKKICILFSLAWVLFSCSEDFKHEPMGGTGSSAPNPVKNARVEKNIPGGAIITYDIPDNVDIQYIKAVYKTSQGIEKDVKVSSYSNRLTIEGLGDTQERKVQLYAVNRQEKQSAPTELTINPLTPPVVIIRNSLTYSADFGGFVINFENEEKEEVAISVLVRDSVTAEFIPYDALYTSIPQGTFPVRGLPDKESDFAVFIRDRFDNASDTLFFTLTPWREDYLNKKLFRHLFLIGDVTWNNYSNGNPLSWFDDVIGNSNWGHTAYPLEFPHRYTLDLGVNVRLSRFKLWQRPGDDVLYQHGAPKYYKVYGRADDPGSGNDSDPMQGWTLLMECNSFKPSGLPLGQNSSEDQEFAAKGEEFSFPRTIPEVRYIRFEMLESWSGMKCSVVSEVAFWGEVLK